MVFNLGLDNQFDNDCQTHEYEFASVSTSIHKRVTESLD